MRILRNILSWLVTLLLPVALLFLGLRLLLTDAFLQIEYRMPGFPPDEYGFTRQDRLRYAPLAVEYLLNDAGVDYLASQTFPDGSLLYNERELSHMHDVKDVMRVALSAGFATWFVILGVAFWARWGGWWSDYVRAVRRGGWLTVGLVAAVGMLAGIDFWRFFTDFHSLFFQGDSWQFFYSDTLIRLFPVRFWQDAVFILIGITAGSGLVLGLTLKPAGRLKAD
jgi:integral membrane protein (TIGR01906 family)